MDILFYSIPVFLSMILTEVLISYTTSKDNYNILDTVSSLSIGAGNFVIEFVGHLTFSYIFQNHFKNSFQILFNITPNFNTYFVLFLLDDLTFYWFHRLSHECRLLWASHVVHHSSDKYNLSTALRQSWTGFIFSPFIFIWLNILGFPSEMLTVARSVSLIYQFWIHTELIENMGVWFEYIFNTPYHHRIHHASNTEYLDCNYGGILIIWDRLFKTIKTQNSEIKYGITKQIDPNQKYTYNPLKIAFHEWINMFSDLEKAKNIRDKFNYVFRGPGWESHSSTKT